MRKLLIAAIWIWVTVAVVQSLFWLDFLTVLLPDVRRTESRGVVSLAPEPGYYATMCLFFLFTLFLYNRERSVHGLACVAQITLLARSTLFTAILIGIMLLYAAVQLNSKKVLAIIALFLAGWFIATQTSYFENTRTGDLTKLAFANPFGLTKLDLSISDRVAQLVFSLKGAVVNGLIPNGFTSWGEYYHSETLAASEYFLYYYPNPYPVRIQSGIGGPFYEMGALGIIPIYVLMTAIAHRFGKLSTRPAVVFSVGIVLTLLPGTPIATPIYGFLLGQLFALKRSRAFH